LSLRTTSETSALIGPAITFNQKKKIKSFLEKEENNQFSHVLPDTRPTVMPSRRATLHHINGNVESPEGCNGKGSRQI
tara:strand:+ start:895 stop:1128 length:234 start_codon:yes stop_codon:yes gene_type:complete